MTHIGRERLEKRLGALSEIHRVKVMAAGLLHLILFMLYKLGLSNFGNKRC